MNENELYHYGVLGMKWGVRRYQNADGSLTDAGRKHYGGDPKDTNTNTKVTWKEARTAKKNEKAAVKKAAETQKKRQEAAKKAAETRKKNQKIAEKEKKVAEKEELTKEQQEKLKTEIMAKADYKRALDNIELFSNADLKNLVDRKTQMNSLDAFKVREKSKIRRGAEKATEILNVIGNLGSGAAKVYNVAAGAVNAFQGGNKNEDGTWKFWKTGK